MNHQRLVREKPHAANLVAKRSVLSKQVKLSSQLNKLKSTLVEHADDGMRDYILTEIIVLEDELALLEDRIK